MQAPASSRQIIRAPSAEGDENMGLAMASPLIVQAVEKVDLVVAKLQELQQNITTTRSCLGASYSGKEKSRQIAGPNRSQMLVRRKNPTRRLQEVPPPCALQKTHGVIDMRGGKKPLPRMKDVLKVEDHDILALPPAEGDWRRWSEPAAAVHQAVSEILVANQYAKEMAGIVKESLDENRCFEQDKAATATKDTEKETVKDSIKGGAPAAGTAPRKVLVRRSQAKNLTEKKIATKAAHRFKVVFPYDGSPENNIASVPRSPVLQRTEVSECLNSPAKREVCPKAKDIKRPIAQKKVTSTTSLKKDAEISLSKRSNEVSEVREAPARSVTDCKKTEGFMLTPALNVHAGETSGRAESKIDQIVLHDGSLEVKTIPLKATEIKQPWNFSQGKTSKVVLFSNPTFVPNPKPVKSSKTDSDGKKKGWIGQHFTSESMGLRRLSFGLRSSSPAKSLPSLISALPSRRKSVDSSQVKPTTVAPEPTSFKAGELPPPPGRGLQANYRKPTASSNGGGQPSRASELTPRDTTTRKGPAACKLKVRDSNVVHNKESVKSARNATAAINAVHKIVPKSEICPDTRIPEAAQNIPGTRDETSDSVRRSGTTGLPSSMVVPQEEPTMVGDVQTSTEPTSPGKENLYVAGCAPGVGFLKRSLSHGNDRFLTLGKSPAGKALLKRAKGWMSFQRTLSKTRARTEGENWERPHAIKLFA